MTSRLPAYAAYLFDLDGTLVDTAGDLNAALNHTLRHAGLETVDEALTRHWVGHGARVMIEQALAAQSAADAATDGLFDVFIQYYERNLAAFSRPYPHVVETLDALLERGARLGVVTNKPAALTLPLLDALSLAGRFQCVVSGDTAPRPKPAPDPALLACERLGVDPGATLFVGDYLPDVGCARAAGCPVVVVRDGYNHGVSATELGADAVIDSFRELV